VLSVIDLLLISTVEIINEKTKKNIIDFKRNYLPKRPSMDWNSFDNCNVPYGD
jgi:hypothetical protein